MEVMRKVAEQNLLLWKKLSRPGLQRDQKDQNDSHEGDDQSGG
jgi:hypothetical protein